MRKICITLLSLLLYFNSFGQGYQTVNSSVTTTFIGNSDGQVESIRIDSNFVDSGDSILYPFYNIQTLDYDCYLPFSYSWIGKKIIIKADGYNYFINREDDTVKMNTLAQLNENWIAYQTSNTIIIAEVIKHDTCSFLGQIDSAKTIAFTAYDQNMLAISHPVNTMTIIISKNFGLLKTMNFSLFTGSIIPYHELQTYNLIGMSSPPIGIVNLTWREIFDFDIGDEIHSVYKSDEPYISVEQKIKYIYLDKTIFSDSINYKVDRELLTKKNGLNINENVYVHDTVTIIYRAGSFLDKLSGEIIGGEYNLQEVRMEMGDIPRKIFPFFPYIRKESNSEDSCWTEIIADGCFPDDTYLKGLGGAYYSCNYWLYSLSNELKYYKKGDVTWGTPLSISHFKMDRDNLVKIYPNPVTDRLNIQLSENFNTEQVTITIYDRIGKLLFEKEYFSDSFINIDVSNFSAGMYFLKISNKQNIVLSNKFIKY